MRRPVARPRTAALAALLASFGAPLTLGVLRTDTEPAEPPATHVASAFPHFTPQRRQPASPSALRRSPPVRLDIPAIGVHTDLMTLGLDTDGAVEVPPLDKGAPAGWYRRSVTPGEAGPAVILGHVDTARDGPAVFYRLGTLKPGDRISVRRADRSTVTFVVDSVWLTPKTDFPTELVYNGGGTPVLNLVTCGGRFDRRHGTYRDNLIVSASIRP